MGPCLSGIRCVAPLQNNVSLGALEWPPACFGIRCRAPLQHNDSLHTHALAPACLASGMGPFSSTMTHLEQLSSFLQIYQNLTMLSGALMQKD
jgi:hypothetical protein